MNRREHRREDRRAAVVDLYNRKHKLSKADFRVAAEQEAERLGFSISMAIIFVRVAIVCYQLWKAANLSQAPEQPMDGEPSFEELS